MNLRVSGGLRERLRDASEKYGYSMSEIVRKALRKNKSVGKAKGKTTTTKKRMRNDRVLTIEGMDRLPEGMSARGFREVIDWYLRIHEEMEERVSAPLELEAGVEGVDYIVVE